MYLPQRKIIRVLKSFLHKTNLKLIIGTRYILFRIVYNYLIVLFERTGFFLKKMLFIHYRNIDVKHFSTHSQGCSESSLYSSFCGIIIRNTLSDYIYAKTKYFRLQLIFRDHLLLKHNCLS